MESHLRVDIVPRSTPLTEGEKAARLDALNAAVTALGNAKHSGDWRAIGNAHAALSEAQAAYEVDVRSDGFAARIGGAEFPLTDFAVQNDPNTGAPMLSLILAPDSIAIGAPAPAVVPAPEPSRGTAPMVSSWGDGSHPDPREGIPGWAPEGLDGQVAGHAETRAQGLDRLRGLGMSRLVGPLGLGSVTA